MKRLILLTAALALTACSDNDTPRSRFLAASKGYEVALTAAKAYRDDCELKLAAEPKHGCRKTTGEMQKAQAHLMKVYEQAHDTFMKADAPFYEAALANVTAALIQLNAYLAEKNHVQ
jgi:hypothetical protein